LAAPSGREYLWSLARFFSIVSNLEQYRPWRRYSFIGKDGFDDEAGQYSAKKRIFDFVRA
jgi:hypothetical protein